MGEVIYYFARGEDETPVQQIGAEQYIKSIGNSTTTPRDLINNEDVKMILYLLTESVCARMREHGFQCRTVSIYMRDTDLIGFTRQCRLDLCTDTDDEVAMAAMKLFESNYTWRKPIRSIGVRVTDFVRGDFPVQLDLMEDVIYRDKQRKLDSALDSMRQRFGNKVVQRASMLLDGKLTGLDPKADHTIFPVSYFK